MGYDQRKLDILKVIVDDYIKTAQPVGSRTVSRKFEPQLSSATIRNEMADLEEVGILIQPHTSSGRVPSQAAFRIYVNQLMGENTLSSEEKAAVDNYFMRHIGDMENLIKSTASLISALTKQTAIALVPQLRRTTLKRLQIIPIIKGAAMVVIVTSTARVKQTVIRVPDNASDDVLHAISTMMTARFAGHSIADIDVSRIGKVEDGYLMNSELFSAIEECILDALVLPDGSDIMVEGTKCAFNFPEYNEIGELKEFLSTFDNRVRLQRLMTEALRYERCILIGDENENEWLHDLSLITAPYKVHGRSVGSIGVIGPMRMDYARVAESLDLVSENLSQVMSTYINE